MRALEQSKFGKKLIWIDTPSLKEKHYLIFTFSIAATRWLKLKEIDVDLTWNWQLCFQTNVAMSKKGKRIIYVNFAN